MADAIPDGAPIKNFSFTEYREIKNSGRLEGLIYPKRNVSQAIGLLSEGQQAAVNLWGWVGILTILAGIIVPIWEANWMWTGLIVLGIMIWRANRKSMDDFFLQQLHEDEAFFNAIAEANWVKIVLKDA